MISFGNKKKKERYRWNYCHYMPMFPLLGATHRLLLLHMDKRFIWNNETKKRINELEIGYNITPGLHINEAFRYRVEKCMNTTYGELTQPFIKATLSKY